MRLISPSVQHYVYPPGLPAPVNRPFVGVVLTLCFNEERRWWEGGSIYIHGSQKRRAHHCSILLHKAIRGPRSPPDYGRCFPYDDTVQWWLVTLVGSEYVACLQWCHCTSCSGKLSWNSLQGIISGEDRGENTSTDRLMGLLITIIKMLFMGAFPNKKGFTKMWRLRDRWHECAPMWNCEKGQF